ncbi:MAG: hypothetical protein WBB94_02545 [Candidatus Saccharimonadaceae bacterium]
MKLSNKSLASLMVATAAAAAMPGASQALTRHKESQFDRLLQRHDRKFEIRGGVLGLEPIVLRDRLKRHSFEEIARQSGLRNTRQFRLALLGYLKNELYSRGWSATKINSLIAVPA